MKLVRNPIILVLVFLIGGVLACNAPFSEDILSNPVTVAPDDVNEEAPTAVPEVTEAAVEQVEQAANPAEICPTAGSDTVQYINEGAGFCMLYPADFEQRDGYAPDFEVVTLVGEPADPTAIETFAPVLNIALTGPVEGLDSSGYALKWGQLYWGTDLSAGVGPDGLASTDVIFNGTAAVLVKNIPAYGTQQTAFLTINGYRYKITLSPETGNEGNVLEDNLNLLWNTVTNSIVFFTPTNPPAYVRAADVCPAATEGTTQYIHEVDGYCYLYPSDFGPDPDFPGSIQGGPLLDVTESWGDIYTSIGVGTFGNFPDSTPREVLEPRSDQLVPGSIEDAVVGGYPAVYSKSAAGPWVHQGAMISVDGFIYTIVAQPYEPEQYPEGIPYFDRLWTTVTDSLTFFSAWK